MCLNCNTDNLRDYPLCRNCETKRHFPDRADCQCDDCKTARAQRLERKRLEEASWVEERQYEYGLPIQAAI